MLKWILVLLLVGSVVGLRIPISDLNNPETAKLDPIVSSLTVLNFHLYTPTESPPQLSDEIKCMFVNEFYNPINGNYGANYTHSYCQMNYFGLLKVVSPYPIMLSPLNYTANGGWFDPDSFYSYTYFFQDFTYSVNLNTVVYYNKLNPNEISWNMIVVPIATHPGMTVLRIGLEAAIKYNT